MYFAQAPKKVTEKASEATCWLSKPRVWDWEIDRGRWAGLQLFLRGTACHSPSHPILRLSSSGQLCGKVWTVSQVKATLCRDPAGYFQGQSL